MTRYGPVRRTLVLTLGLLAPSCHDRPSPSECRASALVDLGRPVEARFADLAQWRPFSPRDPLARSGRTREPVENLSEVAVSSLSNRCDEASRTHAAAARQLALDAESTEETIRMLESLALARPNDLSLANDLAVGYFLRAERTERPIDLLAAHEHAVAASAKGLPAARFNRALIEEKILPPSLAVESWTAVLKTEPDAAWRAEIERRIEDLSAARDHAITSAWGAVRERLIERVDARDEQAVKALVFSHPALSSELVERELLGSWATAWTEGRKADAEVALTRARVIGRALEVAVGDRLASDAVRAIDRARGAEESRLASLAQGHRQLAQLALGLSTHEEVDDARDAEAAFEHGASPLADQARLEAAISRSRGSVCTDEEIFELGAITQRAELSGYRSLAIRALAQRGHCERTAVASFQVYQRADALMTEFQDRDRAAGILSNRIALLERLGDSAAACREIQRALAGYDEVTDSYERARILQTAAQLFRELGATELSHSIADALVADLEQGRSDLKPDQYKAFLLLGLGDRALASVALGRLEKAKTDFKRALTLVAGTDHARTLRSSMVTLEAKLVEDAPERAVELTTKALQELGNWASGTDRATLLSLRAEANVEARRLEAAKQDLEAALGEIDREERENLAVSGNELDRAYFDRFRATLERLLGLLIELGRADETFSWIERARAFEPLNRLHGLDLAPERFKTLTRGSKPLTITALQREIPLDTLLVSYSMVGDRVLIWTISRERAAWSVAPSRRTIEAWVDALDEKVRRDEEPLAELGALYGPLVGDPLAKHGLAKDRVVFLPDGDLQAVPFAALRDSASRRHLIEVATVSVAPSATLFVYSWLRDQAMPRERTPRALLLGDPEFDDEAFGARGLKRLPAAAVEVDTIAENYENAWVFVGPDATHAEFAEHAGKSAVIHIGAHAIANPNDPEESLLLLAREGDDTGAITARELLPSKSLPCTRLVVLAACGSAGGVPLGSLGLGPLVRPFLSAGAPAVVGALWNVKESSGARFSKAFHGHYRQGDDAARAARQAQLEMLGSDSAIHRSVLAWAPFQVIGYASSPVGDAPSAAQRRKR